MFDEQEKAFLVKLTRGLIAEMKKLRDELGAVRAELDEVERIMTGHLMSDATRGGGSRGYRERAMVEISEGLRRILDKTRKP